MEADVPNIVGVEVDVHALDDAVAALDDTEFDQGEATTHQDEIEIDVTARWGAKNAVVRANRKPRVPTIPSSFSRGSMQRIHNPELAGLNVNVFKQSDIEANVSSQIDTAIAAREADRRERQLRLELSEQKLKTKSIIAELNSIGQILDGSNRMENLARTRSKLNGDLHESRVSEKRLVDKLNMVASHQTTASAKLKSKKSVKLNEAGSDNEDTDDESEREKLIRTGKMTPFGTAIIKPTRENLRANRQAQKSKTRSSSYSKLKLGTGWRHKTSNAPDSSRPKVPTHAAAYAKKQEMKASSLDLCESADVPPTRKLKGVHKSQHDRRRTTKKRTMLEMGHASNMVGKVQPVSGTAVTSRPCQNGPPISKRLPGTSNVTSDKSIKVKRPAIDRGNVVSPHQVKHDSGVTQELCIRRCGFFGSADTGGLCSACFKTVVVEAQGGSKRRRTVPKNYFQDESTDGEDSIGSNDDSDLEFIVSEGNDKNEMEVEESESSVDESQEENKTVPLDDKTHVELMELYDADADPPVPPTAKPNKTLNSVTDDGDVLIYRARLARWRAHLVCSYNAELSANHVSEAQNFELDRLDTDNWLLGNEGEDSEDNDQSVVGVAGGIEIPTIIWNSLFAFQRTAVQWLAELYDQSVGGILGDEMGLGKTVQVVSFLTGLHFGSASKLDTNNYHAGSSPTRKHIPTGSNGAILIVCPATMIHQWVAEFHKWWPPFRVAVFHSSGSTLHGDSIVREIANAGPGNVLITTYAALRIQQNVILPHKWHYVVLDEGHQIRNPDAGITIAAKQLHTVHRLILSGSPVQNNLRELWSLFDFIFPGKLGTLPVFMAEFALPMTQGSYINASETMVRTAFECACALRGTISPYLLRRTKKDVGSQLNLPDRTEEVVFCTLTDAQRELYQAYIQSDDVKSIVNGTLMAFSGIDTLRKICNHPDLAVHLADPPDYGHPDTPMPWQRSGKMIVLQQLLSLWHEGGHRVLVFAQTRQMLSILESFVKNERYKYLRMDGNTVVSRRQPLVKKFNEDAQFFIFLLTTRVGGLGINLTGADRIVIVDPDWNPSTDLQARERAWRIGQKRDVVIYRLLTAGTIEEKIYHRQVFKQLLTNRVLKDPKQRRFFKSSDLYDLFSLDDGTTVTETEAIFGGIDIKVQKGGPEDIISAEEGTAKSYVSHCGSSKGKRRHQHNSQAHTATKARAVASVETNTSTGPSSSIVESRESGIASSSVSEVAHLGSVAKVELRQDRRSTADDRTTVGGGGSGSEDYVLQTLRKGSAVHSSLSHDSLMKGCVGDNTLNRQHAKKVARNAVAALRRSARECSRNSISTPTWTGVFGVSTRTGQRAFPGSAAPTEPTRPTAGLASPSIQPQSSAALLSRIRNRASGSQNNAASQTGEEQRAVYLGKCLTDYLTVVGSATTDAILQRFQKVLRSDEAHTFRMLLQELCVSSHKDGGRRQRGQKVWKLKSTSQSRPTSVRQRQL